jgi:hypothetical protein
VPPAYTVAVAAFAVGVHDKWIDNLLSHHELPGVIASRQGVPRIITGAGLMAIELVRIMTDELGMTTPAACAIARAVLGNAEPALNYHTRSGIALHFPLPDLERSLQERLRDAIDAVPRRARGRPPGKKKNAGQ